MRRVEVRTFPSGDAEFRETAQSVAASSWSALAETHAAIVDSRELIAAVQEKLRGRYPLTVVRHQSGLAVFGYGEADLLYVFRDGRIVA